MDKDLAFPGDLLFYRVTPKSSFRAKMIAWVQMLRGEGAGSFEYSHVAIVDIDTDYKIEAVWPRIRRVKINWGDQDMELCRVSIMSWMGERAAEEAAKFIGRWYNVGQMLFGMVNWGKGRICTTLMRTAYQPMGMTLAEEAGDFLSPNELRDDKRIWSVGSGI